MAKLGSLYNCAPGRVEHRLGESTLRRTIVIKGNPECTAQIICSAPAEGSRALAEECARTNQIGGSRSLPESRVVTLRCRPAVVQCVRLPGQEWQGAR